MALFNGPASAIEDNRLKVQVIDENSTEVQYPSAKATYEATKQLQSYANNNFANALKGNASGNVVALKDVSPVQHDINVQLDNSVSVKVCGKNLFKIVSNTVSGVSVSLNKNGEAVLNGTATQSNNFVTTAYIEGGTYTLSSKADKIPTSARQAFISVYNIADKTTNAVIYNYEASDKKATTELASGEYQFRIRIEGGVTYDNYTFRPQLELGNVATEYEPYIEPTTYTADENGRLTLPSMYPSMTIVADSDTTMSVEYNRDINKSEFGGTADLDNYYTKNEIDGLVGDIETALDNIIAMQNSYIGGAE